MNPIEQAIEVLERVVRGEAVYESGIEALAAITAHQARQAVPRTQSSQWRADVAPVGFTSAEKSAWSVGVQHGVEMKAEAGQMRAAVEAHQAWQAVPQGYALVHVDALKRWGVYDYVMQACVHPLKETLAAAPTPEATQPERSRSQRLRNAGFTPRPSWRALPSDDDTQPERTAMCPETETPCTTCPTLRIPCEAIQPTQAEALNVLAMVEDRLTRTGNIELARQLRLAKAAIGHALAAAAPIPEATQPTQAEAPSERELHEMADAFFAAVADRDASIDEINEIKKGLRAALATHPAPEQVELSEDDLMRAIHSIGADGRGRIALSHESGPYGIDRPTNVATRLCRAIEAAIRAAREAQATKGGEAA